MGFAQGYNKTKPARRALGRRMVLATVAVCLLFVGGIQVTAANNPSFELFLTYIGQDLRGLFIPLRASSVSAGIRMEVVAAVNDGKSASIYLTLHDQQGNRIDENTQLLHRDIEFGEGSFISMNRPVHYDEQTKTATYRFDSEAAQTLTGREVKLSLQNLLLGETFHEDAYTGLTVADVMQNNPAPRYAPAMGDIHNSRITYDLSTKGARAEELRLQIENNNLPRLQKDNPSFSNTRPQWASITTAGVVQDKVHLVYESPGDAALFNNVSLYLRYPGYSVEEPMAAAFVPVGNKHKIGWQPYFAAYEAVLPLPPDVSPQDMQIYAQGTTYEECLEGTWEASIIMDTASDTLSLDCAIDMGDWQIHRIEVSPIGVTTHGKGTTDDDFSQISLDVFLQDGTILQTSGASASASGEGEITTHSTFTRPADLKQVSYVQLNGEQYTLDIA